MKYTKYSGFTMIWLVILIMAMGRAFAGNEAFCRSYATNAVRQWTNAEECTQRALHPGHQERRPDRGHELALCVDCEAELPSAIEAYNTVDTGVRAEQEGRDVGWLAASGTEK